MFSYFKWFVFHFLSIVDAISNFLFAIFGVYSVINLSTNFLVFMELKRVDKVIEDSLSERGKKREVAEKGMADARSIVDGKNI